MSWRRVFRFEVPDAISLEEQHTLPVIDGDDLVCPYCTPRRLVELIEDPDELSVTIEDVRMAFKVKPHTNYKLAGICKGCSTVWLAERVSPGGNKGKPVAWDRFSRSTDPRFKK